MAAGPGPAAAVPVNPLFAGAPNVVFRLHENPIKMARSIKNLHSWIKTKMAERVTAEDGVQFFVMEVEGRKYKMQFTAHGGFFTVLVKPPAGWDPNVPAVLLVFSFRDLYLLGFFRDGIWLLYDDAYLIGSGADVRTNRPYWRELGFQGGYREDMRGLAVGVTPMFNALRALSNHDSSSLAIRYALYPFIVAIPEAIRFPTWLRYLLGLLRQFKAEPLNNPICSLDSSFSDWSTMCKRIRRGPAAFVPGDGFSTYEQLVQTVFLLLSRPPKDQL